MKTHVILGLYTIKHMSRCGSNKDVINVGKNVKVKTRFRKNIENVHVYYNHG